MKTPFIALLLSAVLLGYSGWAQEDDAEDQSLSIECKAGLGTAAFYLKNGENAGGQELEESKKRKKIGIGETITLTLNGKQMPKPKDVKWKLTGKGYIGKSEYEGVVSIKVTAQKDLTADTSWTATVSTTVSGEPKTVTETIEVVVPSDIEAEHFNGGTSAWSKVSKEELDDEIIGAGMQVYWIMQPTDVNFSNVNFIEVDGGSVPSGLTMDSGHTGNGANIIVDCSPTHSFLDSCGRYTSYSIIKDKMTKPYNLEYKWICRFAIYVGAQEPGNFISDPDKDPNVTHVFKVIDQVFTYIDMNETLGFFGSIPVIKLTVSKFGLHVTRDNKINKEIFN